MALLPRFLTRGFTLAPQDVQKNRFATVASEWINRTFNVLGLMAISLNPSRRWVGKRSSAETSVGSEWSGA